jgi:hypothetical protein
LITGRVQFDLRRTAAIALCLLLASLLAGCKEQDRAERHEVVSGIVESLHADTGQLTIRTSGLRPESDTEQSVTCLLASDAEIYVNDRFSGLAGLTVGDTVELVGYREPIPRSERFVVALARVRRAAPPAPAPDLPLPTTAPETRPKES